MVDYFRIFLSNFYKYGLGYSASPLNFLNHFYFIQIAIFPNFLLDKQGYLKRLALIEKIFRSFLKNLIHCLYCLPFNKYQNQIDFAVIQALSGQSTQTASISHIYPQSPSIAAVDSIHALSTGGKKPFVHNAKSKKLNRQTDTLQFFATSSLKLLMARSALFDAFWT